jgi:hypothetical protein
MSYHDHWQAQTTPLLAKRMAFKRCGDCSKWMNHRQCPQETGSGSSGVSRGPSMNSNPCRQFAPNANFQALMEIYTLRKLSSGL